MALHCPATLLLVEEGEGAPPLEDLTGVAAEHGPWGDGVDVMAELQALADLHRGERVLVRLARGGTAHVLHEIGRVVPDDSPTVAVRLEVGDDGWVVLPWEADDAR
jgi:hypothetical protein